MKTNYLILCLMAAVTLTGTAQKKLDKPCVKPATHITSRGFTANFEPVAEAEGYCVFVYTKTPVTKDGEYTVIDEDFLNVPQGSIISPAGGEENYLVLDEYTETFGWSAYAFPRFITGMVDGLLYSPYLDLRANHGHYKVVITSYCTDGDSMRIESNGKNGKEIRTYQTHITGGAVGLSIDTLEFDNGSKDLFFSIINNTAQPTQPGFIDRVQVLQDYKKGEEIITMVAANEAVDAVTSWGDSTTSCQFTSIPFKGDATTLYYDMYASRTDFSTPHGSTPYTRVYSPFSDLVKVDLSNKDSEVVTGIISIGSDAQHATHDDAWYNLNGQRVDNPQSGIYIHNNKKVIIK